MPQSAVIVAAEVGGMLAACAAIGLVVTSESRRRMRVLMRAFANWDDRSRDRDRFSALGGWPPLAGDADEERGDGDPTAAR